MGRKVAGDDSKKSVDVGCCFFTGVASNILIHKKRIMWSFSSSELTALRTSMTTKTIGRHFFSCRNQVNRRRTF